MQERTTQQMTATVPARERFLDVGQVAMVLDVSKRSVYRLRDGGRIPAPLRIGRSARWRATGIDDWTERGCPFRRRADARCAERGGYGDS